MNTIERTAKLCHEINRVYCQSIGDFTQPVWDDAPEWQRKSATDGVIFLAENPDAGPESSHNNWLAFKQRDGWSYGPVKDVESKQHPCMVPYDELPADQRFKDAFFHTIVRCMMPPSAGSRPPIGVIPRFIWNEQRADDLRSAVMRYRTAGKPVPSEWISELTHLDLMADVDV